MNTRIGVMARAPSSCGKTRLSPHLSPARLATLRAALLTDTLHALSPLDNVTVFFTPHAAEQEISSLCGTAISRVPQGEGDLGARMLRALQHLIVASGAGFLDSSGAGFPDSSGAGLQACESAILVGSDIPLLTADHIREAAELLRSANRVVLGPADDGGYYLIGMTEPHAGLIEGIEWGTESVLTDTLRAADRLGHDARLLRSAYDIDTIDDLQRLERDLKWAPLAVCPAMRRWLSEG